MAQKEKALHWAGQLTANGLWNWKKMRPFKAIMSVKVVPDQPFFHHKDEFMKIDLAYIPKKDACFSAKELARSGKNKRMSCQYTVF